MEKKIKLVNYLNDKMVKPRDHIEKIMEISGIVFISVEEGWGILNYLLNFEFYETKNNNTVNRIYIMAT